jgi:hypothetical protein
MRTPQKRAKPSFCFCGAPSRAAASQSPREEKGGSASACWSGSSPGMQSSDGQAASRKKPPAKQMQGMQGPLVDSYGGSMFTGGSAPMPGGFDGVAGAQFQAQKQHMYQMQQQSSMMVGGMPVQNPYNTSAGIRAAGMPESHAGEPEVLRLRPQPWLHADHFQPARQHGHEQDASVDAIGTPRGCSARPGRVNAEHASQFQPGLSNARRHARASAAEPASCSWDRDPALWHPSAGAWRTGLACV